jgi:hypothetical protein
MTAPIVTTTIGVHNTHSAARLRRRHNTRPPPMAVINVG